MVPTTQQGSYHQCLDCLGCTFTHQLSQRQHLLPRTCDGPRHFLQLCMLILSRMEMFSADMPYRYIGQEQFLGKVVIEYGAYFLASYFAIGVVFDTFTLGVLAASAVQYSTNTEAFMAAVKEVAGASKRGPNINVIEKAQTAVNAVKVASALNQISGLLKVMLKL